MTGVAAGLALEGYVPVIYSIIPFVTMRNFEQVRNDICYQNLSVKIIGLSAGFAKGTYGHTHHGLEDIGVMRTLPNLRIIAPGDPEEVAWATKDMLQRSGPVYLRLGLAGEPRVHNSDHRLKIDKMIQIILSRQIVGKPLVTLFTTSTMLPTGVEVAERLLQKRINAVLYSVPTIKPLDEQTVVRLAKNQGWFFSLEEHSLIGGLGSSLAEVIAEKGLPVRLERFGVPDRFTKVLGDTEYMRAANGLSKIHIVKKISKLLDS